T
ncbi:hypothetical protein CFC21_083963, partial [Triticum aestivum]